MSVGYRYAMLTLVAALSAPSALGQNWNLPETTTGHALGAFLDVIAGGETTEIESFVRTHMDEQSQRAEELGQPIMRMVLDSK